MKKKKQKDFLGAARRVRAIGRGGRCRELRMSQQAIVKWGNSLALRLPRHIVQEARLDEGVAVELSVRDGSVVVTPVRKKFTLDELLAQMTDGNTHSEVDWGAPAGNEVW